MTSLVIEELNVIQTMRRDRHYIHYFDEFVAYIMYGLIMITITLNNNKKHKYLLLPMVTFMVKHLSDSYL